LPGCSFALLYYTPTIFIKNTGKKVLGCRFDIIKARQYVGFAFCRVDNVSFDIMSCGQCIVRHSVVWTMYHSTLCRVDNVSFDIMSCGQCIVWHYVVWTMYRSTLHMSFGQCIVWHYVGGGKGIGSACGAMGRGIESRLGIGWPVFLMYRSTLFQSTY
jgi:hypothetical protein